MGGGAAEDISVVQIIIFDSYTLPTPYQCLGMSLCMCVCVYMYFLMMNRDDTLHREWISSALEWCQEDKRAFCLFLFFSPALEILSETALSLYPPSPPLSFSLSLSLSLSFTLSTAARLSIASLFLSF